VRSEFRPLRKLGDAWRTIFPVSEVDPDLLGHPRILRMGEVSMTRFPSAGSDAGRTVAIVGGGISGLAAARRFSQRGARVTVLEASHRLGGQIREATVAGHLVEVGAEAVHASARGMNTLITELGLADDLIQANRSVSWLWTKHGLRHLPAGVGPAGPRHLGPVVRSRVMSLGGLARAGLEPLIPRRRLSGDIGVGDFISRRFGRQVAERLVDPVLGGLHAGDINRLSLRATAPELAAVADARGSVILSQRARKSGPPMSFVTWTGGLTTLVERLWSDTDIEVRTSARVSSVTVMPDGRYCLQIADGSIVEVDAVVLAVPAAVAADLLRPLSVNAANLLGRVRFASVATVVVAYPGAAMRQIGARTGTGLLVPSSRGRLLKAATFLSAKWPHLADPALTLVRLSGGRADAREICDLDDVALVARLHGDLADATGMTAKPAESYVQRWPSAMPQLEVGHLELMTSVRQDLTRFPGLALAGASYDGLGIAACVRSGERAAMTGLSEAGTEQRTTS
jgi:oxygen-dependent protoporphyrinogen oxidase